MQFVGDSAGCRLQRHRQGPSFALASLALGSDFTQDDRLTQHGAAPAAHACAGLFSPRPRTRTRALAPVILH